MCNRIQSDVYYVAFLDLLGAKNIIENDTADEHLNNIHNIYQSWKPILGNAISFEEIEMKIFSDNILLAVKCDKNHALYTLCQAVSCVVEHLVRCKYKVRGGITKGSLFIDELMVWGKALVAAYKLESYEAKYPRIIVDQNVVEEVEVKRTCGKAEWLKKDEDYYVLDYLRFPGVNANRAIEIVDIVLSVLDKEDELDEKIKEKNNYFRKYLHETKKELLSKKGKSK